MGCKPDWRPSGLWGLALLAWAPFSCADGDIPSNIPSLGTVQVKGERVQQPPFRPQTESTATGDVIGREGLAFFGGPGRVNPFKALSMLPSVNEQSADPYGLANIPGGNKGLRVRGESSPHGGIGTIDGLPLTAISPGPGQQYLFDMENISRISLYTGPIPPDKLAIFTADGVLDSDVLWPRRDFGGMVSQAFGSFNFHRTFMRVDSGSLPTGTRAFASFSYTHADKWRGPGAAPDFRYNGEIGISQRLSSDLAVRLYAVYGYLKEDDYRPLTYAQASNIGRYYTFDYNAALTGNPAQDINYYGFNRQRFQNYALFSEIDWRPGANSRLLVKPFYSQETGYYLDGLANIMGGPGVRKWMIDHDWYGVVAQYDIRLWDTDFTVGYWFQELLPPGPPTGWEVYRITPQGGLNFAGWALLARATQGHQFNSPYFQLTHQFGAVSVTAGARYVAEQIPSFTVYNTQGIPDTSYEAALAAATSVNPIRSAQGKTFYQWLPYLGLAYRLNPDARLTFAYGRNYGAPAFNNWMSLQMFSQKFQQAGMTAQQGWDTLRPETSENFDLGLHLKGRAWFLQPTVYYTLYHNKIANFYDPRVGVSYNQNVADGHAYGVELAGGVQALESVLLFGSLSYNRATLDENIRTAANTVLQTRGNQFPDTPRFMAKAGVMYQHRGFQAALAGRYMGTRYGDSENTQAIPGYFVADLNLGYEQRLPQVGTLDIGLSFLNLLDRRYIGIINASYVQTADETSFYPGAPFTVAGTVRLTF